MADPGHLPRRDRPAPGELTRGQAFFVNGIVQVLLLGVCLPVGAVAFLLALKGEAIRQAVDHGELLLGAGNAALIGAFSFLGGRAANQMETVGVLVFIATVGILSYAGWAYVTVETVTGETYSEGAVVAAGLAMAFLAVGGSLYLVSSALAPMARRR